MACSGKIFILIIIAYGYLEWITYWELSFNRCSDIMINDHDNVTKGNMAEGGRADHLHYVERWWPARDLNSHLKAWWEHRDFLFQFNHHFSW